MKALILRTILLAALCLSACRRADPAEAEGRTTVRVWAHEGQPAERAAIEGIVRAFNEQSDRIRVVLEFKQERNYGERVKAAAMAGDLPDVLEVDGPYTAELAETGILAPLAPHLPAGLTNDFMEGILAQGTYQDTLYTLGAFDSTVVLYYNRALLAESGIAPPERIEEAWTWEAFLGHCRALKRDHPDVLPLETFFVWGGEWLPYAFLPVIWSGGGRVLSPDGRTSEGALNGPATVRALRAWQKLFTEGLTDPGAPAGQFEQGRAAMAWGIFNRWPIYRDAGLAFGMAPLPGLDRSVAPSGSWCWGLTPAARDPGAAAEVLQWLVGPESGVAPICRANGGIPARESAVDLMPDYASTRGLFIRQARHSAHPRPRTPRYAVVSLELSAALRDIAHGIDPGPRLDEAARAITAALEVP